MDVSPKTFTIIMNRSYATAELEHDVHARVVRLKMVEILAYDVTGAAATPVIGIDIPQFASSCNDNNASSSKILVYTDVSKVHTFYATDIAYTLSSPLYKNLNYRVVDATYATESAINFTNEIIHVALTFEYDGNDIL